MIDNNGSTISQQELEAWLWEAANILRGPVDPANLRDFVFPLLFLRRLSDAWNEEHELAVEAFGEDVDDEVAADFHEFDLPDGCHWNDLRRVGENHGIELLQIMQRIEAANPDKLAQIFGNAPWADPDKMPPERLQQLIEHFTQKSLRPSEVSSDLLGRGYEYLLKQFSDESATSAGQFFTPRGVVHLLVRTLNPSPADSIYDPACGSAGMLIEAANEVVASGGSVAQMRFYGQEINQTSAAIGRMNLFIHDVEDARILRGDTLRDPKFVDNAGKLNQFDVVVANPPFSLDNWGAENWATDPHRRAIGGVPPKKYGDFAWIQHMVASMDSDTGRLGVVMQLGVLSRGRSEFSIRRHMIESGVLKSVVGLPENLFYATTIPTCILLFNSQPHPDVEPGIHFVDANKQFQKGTNQNFLSSSDVETIFLACTSEEGTVLDKTVSRRVPLSEVRDNNWELSIGLYIKAQMEAAVDVDTALHQFEESRAAVGRSEEATQQRLRGAGYG